MFMRAERDLDILGMDSRLRSSRRVVIRRGIWEHWVPRPEEVVVVGFVA